MMPTKTCYGKLLSKCVWDKARSEKDLLSFTIQMRGGALMELKCSNKEPQQELYHSIQVGDSLKITYNPDFWLTPDGEYSRAIGELYESWVIEPAARPVFTGKHFDCFMSVISWSDSRKPAHIAGRYVSHRENTEASRGHFKSYYVTLADQMSTQFVCQLWINELYERKMDDIMDANKPILLLNARQLPYDRYSDMPEQEHLLVTCYAPVVDQSVGLSEEQRLILIT